MPQRPLKTISVGELINIAKIRGVPDGNVDNDMSHDILFHIPHDGSGDHGDDIRRDCHNAHEQDQP